MNSDPMIKRISITFLLSFYLSLLSSQPLTQVRIRLCTDSNPHYLFFRVTSGQYVIDCFDGIPVIVKHGELFIISRYNDKIALRFSNDTGFLADSLQIRGSAREASFSLRTSSGSRSYSNYSGNLECFPDLGSLLLINTVDLEDYIAGVVKAEGGSGKNEEYFKTQAVIARTYTFKYLKKHIMDGYNLCDDTHCQAFNGITEDAVIKASVGSTSGQVLVSSDSSLIISGFHSNCGGETSPSEYAWLSAHPYLVKVIDPFCVTSKNASWEKDVSLKEWAEMLSRNGYTGPVVSAEPFIFLQRTRVQDYVTGSLKIPFARIRNELGLRSAWFSVSAKGDSLFLTGKGYGHGVGLCQEGAMVMASAGKKYEEILRFYYPGVGIVGIDAAKKDVDEKKPSN
jgi:stage II sporulation protein D